MKKESGILLGISSLPGQYGIGGFSAEAENFIDLMVSTGFKIWQILPITSIGIGNSPYMSVSAYAGNYLFICPERIDRSLIHSDELPSFRYSGSLYLTNYDFVRESKKRLIQLAYSRLTPEFREKTQQFLTQEKHWLYDYAAFMTLKDRFGGAVWNQWDKPYRTHSDVLVQRVFEDFPAETGYYVFEQYLFYTQWQRILDYAHSLGVRLFGDLPIYVSYDSVDVWANTTLFQLDKSFSPKKVAGVPPDYFAENGQLWGNPLYNYKKMELDGYDWWIKRIAHAKRLYDIIRIDHFRGLHSYWTVSAAETTARNGKWEKGPGMKLFDALKKAIPDHTIVAEDLGMITKEVDDFVEKSGYYGMRVMQFGFDGDKGNRHLPHNFKPQCVAYTGTHDNDTTLGWLLSLDEQTRNTALSYVNCDTSYGWASGGGQCKATKAFIRAAIASCADIVILPMQDLCGYGSDTRMNTPGMPSGQWEYRTNYGAIHNIDLEFLRTINELYGRS